MQYEPTSRTREGSNRQPRFDVDQDLNGLGAYVTRGTEQLKTMAQDHAGRTVLLAMAAGLGVGVILGKSLGPLSSDGRLWDGKTAESVGQRLIDQLQQASPDAIKSFFKS